MKLLLDIPEVPQGSKTCGECRNERLFGRSFNNKPVYSCGAFADEYGNSPLLKNKKRLRACLTAESAALELLRIKAEKDEEDNHVR